DTVSASSAPTFNWILYSNEDSTPPPGNCHSELNDFLSIKGKNTDFVLSNFGTQDGCCDTGIGMRGFHMEMFNELPNTPAERRPVVATSGPAGCSFVVRANP